MIHRLHDSHFILLFSFFFYPISDLLFYEYIINISTQADFRDSESEALRKIWTVLNFKMFLDLKLSLNFHLNS